MTSNLTGPLWSTLLSLGALGAGIVGGVLFAFSAFVMPGLDRAPAASAILTMQEINREAPKAPLMIPLMGTTLLCLVLGVVAVVSVVRGGERGWWVLAGCVLYLAAFAITAAYHVPHNDALALVDAHASGAAATWHDYSHPWQLWNHVRTAGALGGSLCFVIALLR